jgi:hypothetical protein
VGVQVPFSVFFLCAQYSSSPSGYSPKSVLLFPLLLLPPFMLCELQDALTRELYFEAYEFQRDRVRILATEYKAFAPPGDSYAHTQI